MQAGDSGYDKTDEQSVLEHARRLLGHALRDLYDEDYLAPHTNRGRGNIGGLVQAVHFGLPLDNRPEPDFVDLGIELKVTGLKTLQNGELRAKERLVLSIIDYEDIVGETFLDSSLLRKSAFLLLICYLYEAGVDPTDVRFELADYWRLLGQDHRQIEKDWSTIVGKVRAGLAHELSEGDTQYLGACVKGPGGAKEYRSQPFSETPAVQRAFSFKPRYLNHVVNELMARQGRRRSEEQIPLFSVDEGAHRAFEDVVLESLEPFMGMTERAIAEEFDLPFSASDKMRRYRYVRHMLGVPGRRPIAEFERAGVTLKTIPLKSDGAPKENMSFKAIDYLDLVDEEWETSDLRDTLVSSFLFVFFRSDDSDCRLGDGTCRLDSAFFWHIPENVLDTRVRETWEDAVEKVKAGDYSYLPKSSDTKYVYVNTHGRDSRDVAPTPQGGTEKKRSFWLYKEVIKEAYDHHHAEHAGESGDPGEPTSGRIAADVHRA